MKNPKITFAIFFIAVATLATLFLPSCRKENLAETEFAGKTLTDASADNIAALAARHTDRFFVNEKLGVPSSTLSD